MGLPGLPTRPSVPPERLSLPETAARLRCAPGGVRRPLGHGAALGADSARWVAFAFLIPTTGKRSPDALRFQVVGLTAGSVGFESSIRTTPAAICFWRGGRRAPR
jgi:hypothetical protein